VRAVAPRPAILDGRLTDDASATVPVTDLGLLRGDGAFEVLKLYGGRPFALEDHLARLGRTAATLRLPVDLDVLREDALALAAQAPADEDLALRLVWTRGGRRIALLEPIAVGGAPLALARVTYAPSRLLDGAKSLSYAANMLAKRVAEEQDADDALLVTPHGRVLEGSTSAVFCVLADGTLATPPLEDHILDSITRRRLLALVEADERPIAFDELRGAREAFLASTLREVQAVARIGDVALPAPVPGPITARAREAFLDHVEAELAAA
jgi:branched-chain amino acid aminotransferase